MPPPQKKKNPHPNKVYKQQEIDPDFILHYSHSELN